MGTSPSMSFAMEGRFSILGIEDISVTYAHQPEGDEETDLDYIVGGEISIFFFSKSYLTWLIDKKS